MTPEEIYKLLQRWQSLYDKQYATLKVNPGVSNVDKYMKDELMQISTYDEADKIMRLIEYTDEQFRIECENRKLEANEEELQRQIKQQLDDSTWSMLSDAPLSQEGKKLYREYRQYLRDIPDLWRRQQITELRAMTFDEWRENTPLYKVEKKVIL